MILAGWSLNELGVGAVFDWLSGVGVGWVSVDGQAGAGGWMGFRGGAAGLDELGDGSESGEDGVEASCPGPVGG